MTAAFRPLAPWLPSRRRDSVKLGKVHIDQRERRNPDEAAEHAKRACKFLRDHEIDIDRARTARHRLHPRR